jgi:dimeric dUTPase (all-alpha-NTP-PPase superfamily)
MRQIFEMQWRLNEFTLNNSCGLDYGKIANDPQDLSAWIENYRKAFSAELAEFLRDIQQKDVGSRNGKVEIIDMLHFLVSLSHLVQLDSEEAFALRMLKEKSDISDIVLAAFLSLDDLQNSIKWKWWAKGGGFKPGLAKTAVIYLWISLWEMADAFSLSFEDMKDIYLAKNEVNIQRQMSGYSEDTKTELDNISIKVGK